MQVHEKIKQIRLAKGWTREDMAAKLNLSPQAYGNIERGSTDLTLSRITQIAELFEITPAVLLDGDENNVFNHGVFNKNNYLFQSHWIIHSNSPEYLQLKTEFEKSQLLAQEKNKEIDLLHESIIQLKEIIALMKERENR